MVDKHVPATVVQALKMALVLITRNSHFQQSDGFKSPKRVQKLIQEAGKYGTYLFSHINCIFSRY